jgi:hypothetical protein
MNGRNIISSFLKYLSTLVTKRVRNRVTTNNLLDVSCILHRGIKPLKSSRLKMINTIVKIYYNILNTKFLKLNKNLTPSLWFNCSNNKSIVQKLLISNFTKDEKFRKKRKIYIYYGLNYCNKKFKNFLLGFSFL